MAKFKKVMAKIYWFWLRNFRNKTLKKADVGVFKVTFKRYWVDFSAPRDWWSLRLRADSDVASYLYHSLLTGKPEQVEGYLKGLYVLSEELTKDQGLTDDVSRAINKYQKRLEKHAEEGMKRVSKEDEQRAARELREADGYSKMSKEERKRYNEQFRAAVKDMVRNGEFEASKE